MLSLAINGGTPVRTKPFREAWPVFDGREKRALIATLESRAWCRVNVPERQPSQVSLFEDEFTAYHGCRYGIACANGTAAIEIALRAAGVSWNDEVILPSETFMATATAILQVNAVPVFVDTDLRTRNISPEAIEKAITRKTKAIVPVHLGGLPCDMDAIMKIAKKRKLKVIADCSHAHGSEWKGKKVASLSDLGTFSFQQSKPMTAGEGGMVVTNSKRLAERAFTYHNISGRRLFGRPHHDRPLLTWNYRMTEFQGAILRVQLARLDDHLADTERKVRRILHGILDISGLSARGDDPRVTRQTYLTFSIMYDKDEMCGVPAPIFARAVAREGVPVGTPARKVDKHTTSCYLLHRNPLFANKNFLDANPKHPAKRVDYKKVRCPHTQQLWRRWINLPGHRLLLTMSDKDIDDIIRAFHKVADNIDELKATQCNKK